MERKNNSIYFKKGIYKHCYCQSTTVEREYHKKLQFTFEEIKPISPLVKTVKNRTRWPSAHKPKLKLNNFDLKGKYIHDYINYGSLQESSTGQNNNSINDKISDFVRDMKHTKRSAERWCSTPQKIIVHNQQPTTMQTLKGFYTVKYIGEHNDQIGVLSKKQSFYQSKDRYRSTQKTKGSEVNSGFIDNPYFVNKYFIPRKLGSFNER